MKYTVPFVFHNQQNAVMVDYAPMSDVHAAGFHLLNIPFEPEACIGYPMIHAYFEHLTLTGYERYCGWIQFIRREEYRGLNDQVPSNVCCELDVPDDLRERGVPYFAYGYPPELFDAPCRNLRDSKKVIWRAYTYLVDIPTRINGNQLSYLAGFSWGYTENIRNEVSLLDFRLLSETDWNMQKTLISSDTGGEDK